MVNHENATTERARAFIREILNRKCYTQGDARLMLGGISAKTLKTLADIAEESGLLELGRPHKSGRMYLSFNVIKVLGDLDDARKIIRNTYRSLRAKRYKETGVSAKIGGGVRLAHQRGAYRHCFEGEMGERTKKAQSEGAKRWWAGLSAEERKKLVNGRRKNR